MVTLTVAGAVMALGAVLLAIRSPLLDVDRIEVDAGGGISRETIVDASGIERGEPLLFVDAAGAVRSIENLPWIESVVVERHWPGTVRIVVTERVAVAYATEGQTAIRLDGSGRVLERLAVEQLDRSGLLRIDGVRLLPPPGQYLFPSGAAGIVEAMPSEFGARVSHLDLGRPQDVVLVLVDGLEIRLGDLDDVEAKVAAASAVLDALGEEAQEVDYIDVRVPATPVAGGAGGADGTDRIPDLSAPVRQSDSLTQEPAPGEEQPDHDR